MQLLFIYGDLLLLSELRMFLCRQSCAGLNLYGVRSAWTLCELLHDMDVVSATLANASSRALGLAKEFCRSE